MGHPPLPTVNLIGGVPLNLAQVPAQNSTPFFTPLILASAGIGTPERYTGKIGDWFAFKAQWELWVRTMAAQNGSDDALIFAYLSKVLDDGERAQLQMLRELNPAMTYQAYWAQLVREKERFSGQILRQSIEALTLESRGKISSSKAKEYAANFARLARQIPGLPDEEALRIMVRQVPKFLAEKIQSEVTRRRDRKKVRIWGLLNMGQPMLEALVRQLIQTPPARQPQGDCQENLR